MIVAHRGKIFRRKIDGKIMGKVVHLGYIYYIDGKKLPIPHKEVPEDFEEIDE